ncbi:MAG TPA: DUF481 domain-containing protein, partial [Terracidiphilus sp.]|nr:DUF481 domain-containing protein [Terracidiphilus sp.]
MFDLALRKKLEHVAALLSLCLMLAGAAWPRAAAAAVTPDKPKAEPPLDVMVLSNGDTLHGHLVSAMDGKVTFHSDPLGDVTVTWDKIRSLQAHERFAVVNKNVQLPGRGSTKDIPVGELVVQDGAVTVEDANAQPTARIPVEDSAYILKQETVSSVAGKKSIFTGWSGSATAGAAIVTATQKQYTVSGGIHLVRVMPTVTWLRTRNRTTLDFTGSFGKIVQPGYLSGGTFVPELVTKSAIYHADAERDEYFTPRLFALGQTAFDHNYSQSLDLQQIYGGGLGWTVLKTPRQETDLKATVQYELQQFIPSVGLPPPPSQHLVGSTFSANYSLHLRLLTF